ncbi:MAG: HD domain-containing protein [Syntrophales bacterium LBB04]|nr:HD domain-containing protein [Syntrophales bacterium LBB04]
MDRKNVMERIQTEAISKAGERVPLVVLNGLNAEGRKALLGRTLNIRYFPFRIGRLSAYYGLFSNDPDLMIEDEEPYLLSRRHLVLERRDGRIFAVDEGTRSGSLVNGVLLGGEKGKVRELPLKDGSNDIVLGGGNYPFVFDMKVVQDHEGTLLHDEIPFGDVTAPVALLYGRLCYNARMILTSADPGNPENVRKGLDLIRGLLSRPEVFDPLYYFSSSPETFFDVVTAHSVNVAVYAVKLARSMSYEPEKIAKIGVAALLHDVGLLDIPPQLVNTQKELSGSDLLTLQEHTIIGYAKLKGSEQDLPIVPVTALEHHERVDGKGYPRGISSPAEEAELIGIVDFLESVTHYRAQRGPITPHEGMRMLLDQRHEIFSKDLLRTFIHEFSVFPVFSIVRLNTGDIGQVVKVNPAWPLRPVVRIFFQGDGQPVLESRIVNLWEEKHLYIAKDISDRVFIDHYFRL